MYYSYVRIMAMRMLWGFGGGGLICLAPPYACLPQYAINNKNRVAC